MLGSPVVDLKPQPARFASVRAVACTRSRSRIGRTVPQVVFRFALQVGMIALTGTTSAEHMAADLGVHDFELAPGDVRTLDELVA